MVFVFSALKSKEGEEDIFYLFYSSLANSPYSHFFSTQLNSLQEAKIQRDSKFTTRTALKLAKQLAKMSAPSFWHRRFNVVVVVVVVVVIFFFFFISLVGSVLMFSLQAMSSSSLLFTSRLVLAIIRAECDFFCRIFPSLVCLCSVHYGAAV